MPRSRLSFKHSCLVSINRGQFSLKYEKTRVLGSGADGTAYVVKEKKTGDEFVGKEAHDIKGDAKEKFLQEFEKMRRLNHQNVLKVYELIDGQDLVNGQLHDALYVITDLAKGGDLNHYLQRVTSAVSELTEEWVAGVFRQAMLGVRYLHDEGIVHNDLKPENILIMEEFDPQQPLRVPLVVLTDFGRASLSSEFQHGDLRYQSPETWRNAMAAQEGEYVDMEMQDPKKADVWAMGATLFELLSGGKVVFLYEQCDFDRFMQDDVTNRFKARLLGTEPIEVHRSCAGISTGAEGVLTRMLEKDAAKRPSASKALEEEWFHTKGKPLPMLLTKKVGFHATKGAAHAVLLNGLASKLRVEHYKHSAEIFGEIDDDGSGFICLDEFKKAFSAKLCGEKPEAEIKNLFRMADVDGNGKMSFSEFVAVTFDWSSLEHDALEKHLQNFFKELDENGDDEIAEEELGTLFQNTLDRKELHELFLRMDSNGDGKISLHELRSFLFTAASAEEYDLEQRREQKRQGCLQLCLEGFSKFKR